jgi:hypothetical protein
MHIYLISEFIENIGRFGVLSSSIIMHGHMFSSIDDSILSTDKYQLQEVV